jgi:MFS family permease
MMFLQFFIWAAWFVTLSAYLGQGLKLQGDFIGRAYSTMPWGAIVAPFLVGMIADRFLRRREDVRHPASAWGRNPVLCFEGQRARGSILGIACLRAMLQPDAGASKCHFLRPA